MNKYTNWDVVVDEQHIIWLGVDRKDTSVNAINEAVLEELNNILQDISALAEAKGLVIYSKKKGFIAGADVNVFSQFKNEDKALEFLRKGQNVFSRIEQLKIPSVAMIDGHCLGGGLELALACDYRIASDEKATQLGLPEIWLGFHPGWGGTVRLPRLIGGQDALTVILSGKMYHAKQAKKMGFVDEVVPLRQLKRAAVYFLSKRPEKHKPTFKQSLTNISWIKPIIAKISRFKLQNKGVNPQHYPAYFSTIDLWEKESHFDDRAYRKEADSVKKLVSEGETAKNLIRVFQLRERLKGFAKASQFKARHVHVVGAGTMGGDIAAFCALKGLHVTIQDQNYEKIAPAIARANRLFRKKLRSSHEIQSVKDHLIPDPQGFGIAKADVIIEAVFENLKVKQDLFQQIEKQAKPDAILATNTSSIPLDEISAVMIAPTRLVGIHFFNPVEKMDLVEVVQSTQTSKEVAAQACAFVNQIAHLPLPVKSSPGFLVNRVLMPYLVECVHLLEEGYKPEEVDKAAKAFGMFMGPVELADTVGIDVCLAVAKNLTSYYGGSIPARLEEMVQLGKLGKKSGEGFYTYKNGRPIKQKVGPSRDAAEIANRLILRMVNESAACLREGVVEDADLLDAGMIFATGFAPFRGGPMHYAQHFGHDKLNELFVRLETQYGERFKANADF
jgi:3-hydroxyacyl-CoA dehydrogenase/enoyl-CoA hydratase/3-hydroxybutyryl-CoA epimerase